MQGRGEELNTLENEGQMIQRVMPELMGIKNIMVINDEAHHCYREKRDSDAEKSLNSDDKKEAAKNIEAARLWISGLEAVNRKLGITRVMDLSATPFFLRGSGYAEGTLFPWTVSDFSLIDAIKCGIGKLPRVPVADNIPGGEMPKFRNLWEHIGTRMPKKGRARANSLDPLSLPVELLTALEALYGHYEKTFELWKESGIQVPPCFIVIHSYLTYLRDRLTVARDLLNESGSIFVQIGDENVHRVREILEEIFGSSNFVSQISFKKTGFQASNYLPNNFDIILWFAKDYSKLKYRRPFVSKLESSAFVGQDVWFDDRAGRRRRLTRKEKEDLSQLSPENIFRHKPPESAGSSGRKESIQIRGREFSPKQGKHFSTTEIGMKRLKYADRLMVMGNSLRYIEKKPFF